jgi:hypothetical protein
MDIWYERSSWEGNLSISVYSFGELAVTTAFAMSTTGPIPDEIASMKEGKYERQRRRGSLMGLCVV